MIISHSENSYASICQILCNFRIVSLHYALCHSSGERLSLLVLRTAPGLGNVTVDWTVRGPSVHRTFTQTSGKLFFAEVMHDCIVLLL